MTDFRPQLLSLKQIRVIAALAKTTNSAQAAESLHMSPPSLSRALSSAEGLLGVSLFQRGWSGAETTAMGEIVVAHCETVLNILSRFERDLAQPQKGAMRFPARVNWRQLKAVYATAATGSAKSAAQHLGISQPAVSRTLADISLLFDAPLFKRRPHGLLPTNIAHALCETWGQIERELTLLPDRIRSASAERTGRLAVGMLPFSSQNYVLETFGQLTKKHPRIRLSAFPGSYSVLLSALRRREIDLIIGTLRGDNLPAGFKEEHLFDEHFTMLARSDHPIHRQKPSLEALAKLNWIVGPHGSPVRAYFERAFRTAGLSPPAQSCEIVSFTHSEQMIAYSDSAGLLMYGPSQLKQLRRDLQPINIDLPDAKVPIGLTLPIEDQNEDAISEFLRILKSKIER
ncbi:MAG: LysR family transcriptional regulator [Cognatishimia sp.]